VAEHPVKVTPELFAELRAMTVPEGHAKPETVALLVADKAAQWGADQELEACCEWLDIHKHTGFHPADSRVAAMRYARRPKPPSFKEQALKARKNVWRSAGDSADWEILDRAIEALPDD
jgi:hypothetical protein